MFVSNGGSSVTRRKLGLSNSTTESSIGKLSSRRLINSQSSTLIHSSSKSSYKHGSSKSSSGKNLNEQLKLKKSFANKVGSNKTKKSSGKLISSGKNLNSQLKNSNSKSSSVKKQKLKERRKNHAHLKEDEENDENEPHEYRFNDDDMNIDEIDNGITNEFDTPLIHMCREEFERADKYLETRLDDLKKKLDTLRGVDLLSSSTHRQVDPSEPYLADFCSELDRLEQEAQGNLTSIRFWFEKEISEIEEHFKNECKRSIHEFQERRKELKDTLRNENEDVRRQIEIERQTLDINSDVIEVKPAPTRNLRRRCGMGGAGTGGTNVTALSTNNSIFSSQVYIDYTFEAAESSLPLNPVVNNTNVPPQTVASTSFINSNQSPLLTNNLSTVVDSISSGSSVNGFFYSSLIQQQVLNGPNSLLNGNIMDRKQRKVGPLAITISEDEINEDHRCLLRSLRQPHSASPKVQASTTANVNISTVE